VKSLPQPSRAAAALADHDGMRPALLSDLPRMTEIYNQAVPERNATADTELRSPEDRQDWFAAYSWSAGCPLLVVEEDGRVVGYAGATSFRPEKRGYDGCLEVTLYVARSARGRGLGRRLGRALTDVASELGNRLLLALVFADNSHSNGLFAHLGYSLRAHLPGAIVFPEDAPRSRDVGIWSREL
jgi:phosphinothricin acetyltransferase